MVQKIRNYTGNFANSLNYQPTTTSGLEVSHLGGAFFKAGVALETAAGSITVPDNTSWSVYIDGSDNTLKSTDTASLPTSNIIVLWQGTSANGEVTSLTDVRSWTSIINA